MNPVRSKKSEIFAEIPFRTSNGMKTERTSVFLMANLGSEVSRIFSAKEKNNPNLLVSAITRARAILSELKTLPDIKNNKEIDILADVIDDLGQVTPKYQIIPEHLKSYFYPFAMKVMQNLT